MRLTGHAEHRSARPATRGVRPKARGLREHGIGPGDGANRCACDI
jgi:hypothetical protein